MQNVSFLYTLYFYTNLVQFYIKFVVLHQECSFTLCVQFYTLCLVLQSVCRFIHCVQFYTQCVVLHSVCSFTLGVQFHTRCVVLHSMCSFTQKCVFGPINHDLCNFFCEIRFVLIHALLGVNLYLRKSYPCKENNIYEVCIQITVPNYVPNNYNYGFYFYCQ